MFLNFLSLWKINSPCFEWIFSWCENTRYTITAIWKSRNISCKINFDPSSKISKICAKVGIQVSKRQRSIFQEKKLSNLGASWGDKSFATERSQKFYLWVLRAKTYSTLQTCESFEFRRWTVKTNLHKDVRVLTIVNCGFLKWWTRLVMIGLEACWWRRIFRCESSGQFWLLSLTFFFHWDAIWSFYHQRLTRTSRFFPSWYRSFLTSSISSFISSPRFL